MKRNGLLTSAVVLALVGCTQTKPVQVVEAVRGDVESTVSTITAGTVRAQNQAALSFGAVGRVQRIHIKVGDRVKKGQMLAEIENADAKIAALNARAEWVRVRELFSSQLVSQSGLDEAKRQLELASSVLQRTQIMAPFAGIVAELTFEVGESSGAATATLAAPSVKLIDELPRIIEGEIDELDLSRVKVGQVARTRIAAVGKAWIAGKVTRVVPYITSTREQDRTSRIEITLDNPDPGIPVGASAEVEIVTERRSDVLILPSRAVLGTGQSRSVFVVVDGRLKRQAVELGAGNYDRREIANGIKPGDLVALPSDTSELQEADRVATEKTKWP
jgi:HlyD family secretion protein